MNKRTHEYTELLKKAVGDLQSARDNYYTTDWPKNSIEEQEVFKQMSNFFKEVALLKALITEISIPVNKEEEVAQ